MMIFNQICLSLIFPNKYLASTTIEPSAVHISSNINLFMGYRVIWNMAYSRNEFLLSFYKKYKASSSSDPKTLVR